MEKSVQAEMEKFIRAENVKRYQKLLERVTDEDHRQHVQKLLAEEEQKQIEAGDFSTNSCKQAI